LAFYEQNCLAANTFIAYFFLAHGKRSTPQSQPTIEQLAERWALIKLAPERHVNRFVHPEVRDYEEPRLNEGQFQGYKLLTNAEFPVNHISAPSIRLRLGRQRPIKLVSPGDFFESTDTIESQDSEETAGKNLQILNLLNSQPQKFAA
jgi:hypothetical protein